MEFHQFTNNPDNVISWKNLLFVALLKVLKICSTLLLLHPVCVQVNYNNAVNSVNGLSPFPNSKVEACEPPHGMAL